MKLKKTEIIELITLLGFKPQEGEKDVYYKNYPKHKDYIVKVDFEKEAIEYGIKIKLGDLTTCHFENSENFVVLECVDRVLEKGYPPECLTLEKKWPMGRKEKGKLDILIADKGGKTYMMIECKTWGEEYEKEKKKMQRDGGQLFSYFQQDKSAQYLCLYASRFVKGQIEFVNEIVQVDEQWKELSNQKEIFDHWNKNFKDNGIFEDWASAYDIEVKALTRNRLKELTEEDSSRIFNQFAEILRHNVVSDKPNAFNKIFNLFLCKIVDEDRKPDEELKFQWLESDTDEDLQKRLSDLYKQGMKEYLTKEVTDYNDEQVAEKLYALDPETREQIRDMFTRVRLHKNNDFAFKEVFDEKSFKENSIVVREVVELLQPYQIRYSQKQQFLGDFFELLLTTGLKQEAGQFFTPVPIAKFIVSSLPIRELIQRKITAGETNFLPFVIDYAAGSGHFLTEAMDELQRIIEEVDLQKLKPSITSKLKSWRESPFDWAHEYIYGIELDYRLVKTAKVSCFLNGDGLANIIHADGLDHFGKSVDYKGKLKEVSKEDRKDNGQFDILVANPPYSVSAFKNTLKSGDESFELFGRLTDNSPEIECLFIERTKQLLKPGGIAGLVLPATILNNPGIYQNAREILLKYFRIKAIAKFGNNTFMATGTPTIVIFLERRDNNEWRKIENSINTFFTTKKDFKIGEVENAVSEYVSNIYGDIPLKDYIEFIDEKYNSNIDKEELFIDYKDWYNNLPSAKKTSNSYEKVLSDLNSKNETDSGSDILNEDFVISSPVGDNTAKQLSSDFYQKVIEIEKKRMLFYFLTSFQEIVHIDVGEKKDEKDFLGYEFSERRGHEGIKMYKDNHGKFTTKLYDVEGLNEQKANYYINNIFNNSKKEIHESLTKNVSYVELTSLMQFNQLEITNAINLTPVVNPFLESKHTLVRAKDIFLLEYGKPLAEDMRVKGEFPVMGSNGITGYHNEYLIVGPSIIVGRKGSAGKITFVEENCFPIDTTFYVSNKSEYPLKYIYYLLLALPLKSLSKSMGVPGLNRNDVHALKVPLIDKDVVKQKIEHLDKMYENRTNTYNPKLKAAENDEMFMESFKAEIIKTFCETK